MGGVEEQSAHGEGLDFQHEVPVPNAEVEPGEHRQKGHDLNRTKKDISHFLLSHEPEVPSLLPLKRVGEKLPRHFRV